MKYSIGFVLIVLVLGLLIGAVLGSLIEQVFGLTWLNVELFGEPLLLADDFYIVKRLEVQLTPGALLGLLASGYYLYRRVKKGPGAG
ncbi:MAG: hypothetical protein KDK35_13010 [Leptospiraceae bacterium]|nr:hypothetical protein [Leptospiraceae bacterium]